MGFMFFGKNKIIIGTAIGFCAAMVLFPEVTAAASKTGILLWLNSIVPMLLPFFIFANFLKSTGIVRKISPRIYPFIMAVLSGYPMGAMVVGDYYREGIINKDETLRILSYSMVTGPAFLVGAVGVEFLGSYKCGLILALSHYLSALINGLFHGSMKSKGEKVRKGPLIQKDSYYSIFTDAILDSFKSMAIILAYIIIFMILTDLIQFSGLLSIIKSPAVYALIKGVLEMTVGCNAIGIISVPVIIKMTLASFIVTFGGLSVMGQSISMLKDCDITLFQIFKIKLIHGVIAAIITFSISSFIL